MSLCCSPVFGQTFTVTRLPSLGGTTSIATGINATGVVVGYSANAKFALHGVRWSGGAVTDLGTLGGALSYAAAINGSGQVVGYSDTAGDALTEAAVWTGGNAAGLGNLGGPLSYAYGINDSGQTVGCSTLTVDNQHYMHAMLRAGGVVTDLGTLGGLTGSVRGSSATAINAAGTIVGFSDTARSGAQHATLWQGNKTTDLGTLGGDSSAAYAINATGHVVGQSDVSGNKALHAALWNNDTTAIDLGTLGGNSSAAFGINLAGNVVGTSQTKSNSQHATLWIAGQIFDLHSLISPALPSNVTLTVAVAINDGGEIAVYGNDSQTGGTDAFLLTPSTANSAIARW